MATYIASFSMFYLWVGLNLLHVYEAGESQENVILWGIYYLIGGIFLGASIYAWKQMKNKMKVFFQARIERVFVRIK